MPHASSILMAAADSIEGGGRRSSLSALAGFGVRNKPLVEISLDDEQKGCFVPSYTTLEKIQGTVSMTPPTDMPFDEIHITFQGSSKTYVEKMATSAPTNPRSQAYTTFLRLAQPIEDSLLPPENVARAGVTYKFPFMFVVPERLLPQACSHSVENETVREAHLALPPSLGDPMMAGDGKSLLDDMAPANTQISYGLRVFVIRKNPNGSRPLVLCDNIKKLRIIPAVDEAPPLRVFDSREDDYVMSKTKTLKRGTFKGKLGSLTMEAAQPRALVLHGLRSEATCPVTSMAVVHLRFDPLNASYPPPRLGSLSSKLKVATFFSSIPLKSNPCKSQSFLYDSQKGAQIESIALASRCVQATQWERHLERRDSAIDLPDYDGNEPTTTTGKYAAGGNDSSATGGMPFYTARILVPVDLPTKCGSRTFVPTFNSCLVSRLYALDLSLTVHPPSASVSPHTLTLKLPIQVAAEGNADATPLISEEEAESIARREADGVFIPRSVAPPRGPDNVSGGPPPPPSADASWMFRDEMRGARGSIFTPRSGSWSENMNALGGLSAGAGGAASGSRAGSRAASRTCSPERSHHHHHHNHQYQQQQQQSQPPTEPATHRLADLRSSPIVEAREWGTEEEEEEEETDDGTDEDVSRSASNASQGQGQGQGQQQQQQHPADDLPPSYSALPLRSRIAATG